MLNTHQLSTLFGLWCTKMHMLPLPCSSLFLHSFRTSASIYLLKWLFTRYFMLSILLCDDVDGGSIQNKILSWNYREVLHGYFEWRRLQVHQLTNSQKVWTWKTLSKYVIKKERSKSIYMTGHSQKKHSYMLAHFSLKCVSCAMGHPVFQRKKITQENESFLLYRYDLKVKHLNKGQSLF